MSFLRLAYKIAFFILCCELNKTLFSLRKKKKKLNTKTYLLKNTFHQLLSQKTFERLVFLFSFGTRSVTNSRTIYM